MRESKGEAAIAEDGDFVVAGEPAVGSAILVGLLPHVADRYCIPRNDVSLRDECITDRNPYLQNVGQGQLVWRTAPPESNEACEHIQHAAAAFAG